jgi:hypothetical protein
VQNEAEAEGASDDTNTTDLSGASSSSIVGEEAPLLPMHLMSMTARL